MNINPKYLYDPDAPSDANGFEETVKECFRVLFAATDIDLTGIDLLKTNVYHLAVVLRCTCCRKDTTKLWHEARDYILNNYPEELTSDILAGMIKE